MWEKLELVTIEVTFQFKSVKYYLTSEAKFVTVDMISCVKY